MGWPRKLPEDRAQGEHTKGMGSAELAHGGTRRRLLAEPRSLPAEDRAQKSRHGEHVLPVQHT